jgi:hypothetical protein
VTAASMEPRGAVGVYLPAEDRHIIHSPVQRASLSQRTGETGSQSREVKSGYLHRCRRQLRHEDPGVQ